MDTKWHVKKNHLNIIEEQVNLLWSLTVICYIKVLKNFGPVLISRPLSKPAKNCSPSSRSHRSEGWGPSYCSDREWILLSTWGEKEKPWNWHHRNVRMSLHYSTTDHMPWYKKMFLYLFSSVHTYIWPCYRVNTVAELVTGQSFAVAPGTGL